MAIYPLRKLPSQSGLPVIDAWIEQLEHELAAPNADRAEICRRTLCALTFPAFASSYETAVNDPSLPLPTRAALMALDPRNVSLEPEYYAECDDEQFQRVKPRSHGDRRAKRRGGSAFSAHAREAHLQAVRRAVQGLSQRRVLLWV